MKTVVKLKVTGSHISCVKTGADVCVKVPVRQSERGIYETSTMSILVYVQPAVDKSRRLKLARFE